MKDAVCGFYAAGAAEVPPDEGSIHGGGGGDGEMAGFRRRRHTCDAGHSRKTPQAVK
jgi:hypothetical protein